MAFTVLWALTVCLAFGTALFWAVDGTHLIRDVLPRVLTNVLTGVLHVLHVLHGWMWAVIAFGFVVLWSRVYDWWAKRRDEQTRRGNDYNKIRELYAYGGRGPGPSELHMSIVLISSTVIGLAVMFGIDWIFGWW
jgi:hypothetical protein